MNKFTDKIMYKKAAVGESIIDEYLRKNNIIAYSPVFDGKHPFDRLCSSQDKENIYIVEVKSISKRNKYNDTGISIKHYNEYKFISKKYNIPLFIFFVDEKLKEIYGNTIDELDKSFYDVEKDIYYPLRKYNKYAVGKEIIYFPMANMKRGIGFIKDEFVKKLKDNSNYGYEVNPYE